MGWTRVAGGREVSSFKGRQQCKVVLVAVEERSATSLCSYACKGAISNRAAAEMRRSEATKK